MQQFLIIVSICTYVCGALSCLIYLKISHSHNGRWEGSTNSAGLYLSAFIPLFNNFVSYDLWKNCPPRKPKLLEPKEVQHLTEDLLTNSGFKKQDNGEYQMKFNSKLAEILKDETAYLEEYEFRKNEHGVYVYISADGNSRISLDSILLEYKEWLIEQGIVKLTKN